MSELRLGFEAEGFAKTERKVEARELGQDPPPWDLDTTLRVVGADHPRLEAPLKVSGQARYSYDVRFPDLIYARLLGSPHANARVKSIDLSAAKAHPGVLYAEDLSRGGQVRYAGQAVAGLAATSEEALDDALRLIAVDYEVTAPVTTIEAALAEGAPSVQGRSGNASPPKRDGDKAQVAAAHATPGAVVVEATYRTQVQTHSCLESHGCVAKWEGDQLTVWASTQGTFATQGSLARALQIPASQVRVITEHMGGGFGSKFGADLWDVFCARAAQATGRPCRLMLDRAEEHLAGNRPDSIQACKFSVKPDGTLLGAEVRALGTGGVGGGAGVTNPMIYRFQAEYSEQRDVATHASSARAFRAPRHPQGSFALEGMLDELAEAIGMDPLALRLKNDPHPVRQAQWKRGAELIGWSRRKASGSDGSDSSHKGPLKRGLGLAGARWKHNGRPGSAVLVRVTREGQVEVRNGAQDIGSGARTLLATLVAEELGLRPNQVAVAIGDTRDPAGPASGGSTTSPSLAPPARQAGYRAKRALIEAAARGLKVSPDETAGWDLVGGKLTGAPKELSFAQVCALLPTPTLEVSGRGERDDFKLPRFADEVAGCQFAEVEVDVELGTVRVLKVVAVQDCGTVVNALTARSQINGAVIQGISYALFEERLLDPHSGRQVNPDLLGYKILGSLDLPEIVAVPLSVHNGITSSGVSSLGEPPAVPTAAAIANAVANAIGARVRSLPITPDKVLAALAAPQEQKK